MIGFFRLSIGFCAYFMDRLAGGALRSVLSVTATCVTVSSGAKRTTSVAPRAQAGEARATEFERRRWSIL